MLRYSRSGANCSVVDHNPGPVIYKEVESRVPIDGPVKLTYKAAKPYLKHTAPFLGSARFESEKEAYWYPSSQELLSHITSEHLTTVLKQSYGSSLIEATHGAHLNSVESMQLLAAVSAAEAKETYGMVKSVFVTLFNLIMDFYKSCKKGDLLGAADAVADTWLQWRYGWRPFIGELETLRDMLLNQPKPTIRSSYGGSRCTDVKDVGLDSIAVQDSNGSVWTYDVSFAVADFAVKSGFNYVNVENSRNDSLLAQIGLDADSILSTAWDLVPFSFVIDFFLNVGDMLASYSHADDIDVFNPYISSIYEGNLTFTCKSTSLREAEEVAPVSSDVTNRWYELTGDQFPKLTDPEHYRGRRIGCTRFEGINIYQPHIYGKIANKGTHKLLRSLGLDHVHFVPFAYGEQVTYSKLFTYSKRGHPYGAIRILDPDGTLANIPSTHRMWHLQNYLKPFGVLGRSRGLSEVRSRVFLFDDAPFRADAQKAFDTWWENVNPKDSYQPFTLKSGSKFSSYGAFKSWFDDNFFHNEVPADTFSWTTRTCLSVGIRPALGVHIFEDDDVIPLTFACKSFCRTTENPGFQPKFQLSTTLSSGQWADLGALAHSISRSYFK